LYLPHFSISPSQERSRESEVTLCRVSP
jgi:hypothetical protein